MIIELIRRRLKGLVFRTRSLFVKIAFEIYALLESKKLFELRKENKFKSSDKPLVSVTIATYNRSNVLIERTLPSIFQQSYQNFEIIIVGDHCTDDTESRIKQIDDPRIRFINLPERGKYPSDPVYRRLVAGIYPINKARELAQGEWLAHIDDDDVWEPNHLETMLKTAIDNDFEFVSSIMQRELEPGNWHPIERGHSTFLVRCYLKSFRYDINAWRYSLGADAQMLVRLNKAGVRMGYVNVVSAYAPLRPGITRFDHLAEDRH